MSIVSGSHLISGRTKSVLHLPLMNEHNRSITGRGMKGPELLKSELRVAHVVEALETANLDQLRAELYLAELQKKRLLARLQEVKNDRNNAKAKLKTVEQERDDTKARLKTVEKERDHANERVRLAIAEWYRLEKAAYGAPGLGGI